MTPSKFSFSAATGINKVVMYLTYSDLIIMSSWGLVAPFLAVFIAENITDGTIAVAGFATTIHLIIKSLVQLPIAKRLDSKKGEFDDFKMTVIGSILFTISIICYAFATTSVHIYLIQILSGLSAAISAPGWYAIFSRHMDKNNEAFEWSFYDTIVGVGTALTASIGGLMLLHFSYRAVFLLVAGLTGIGILFLISIKDQLYKK